MVISIAIILITRRKHVTTKIPVKEKAELSTPSTPKLVEEGIKLPAVKKTPPVMIEKPLNKHPNKNP